MKEAAPGFPEAASNIVVTAWRSSTFAFRRETLSGVILSHEAPGRLRPRHM